MKGNAMHGVRMVLWAGLLAALVVWAAGTPALAADPSKPELALTISAQKEVTVKNAEGKVGSEWQEVREANPGDVVKYTISYKNVGKVEARDARIVDPIPRDTTYVSGSAEGKSAEIGFSLDGKTFQAPPLLKYKVRQADGTVGEYQATPEMYTHIQWRLLSPVPPGGAGSVSFKTRVK